MGVKMYYVNGTTLGQAKKWLGYIFAPFLHSVIKDEKNRAYEVRLEMPDNDEDREWLKEEVENFKESFGTFYIFKVLTKKDID